MPLIGKTEVKPNNLGRASAYQIRILQGKVARPPPRRSVGLPGQDRRDADCAKLRGTPATPTRRGGHRGSGGQTSLCPSSVFKVLEIGELAGVRHEARSLPGRVALVKFAE